MTPSVPGKAYFIAENHRHSAANSLSVNSYLVGARSAAGSGNGGPPRTASGGTPRTASGKGTILVCSDTSSRSPPIIVPHIQAVAVPNSPARTRPALLLLPMPHRGKRDKHAFAHYLSIKNRYSTRIK